MEKVTPQIGTDTLLIDLVRDLGCYSVKRGCETSNCGLCTVFMDDQPILSCSILAARVSGHKIDTLEGFCGKKQTGLELYCRTKGLNSADFVTQE